MGSSIVSKNIRYVRMQHKLTQGDIARITGVTRGKIASYEQGVTPKYDFIIRFADYFDISVDNFLRTDLEKLHNNAADQDVSGNSVVLDSGVDYKGLKIRLKEKEQLIESLREQLRDKERIIHFLEEKLKQRSG